MKKNVTGRKVKRAAPRCAMICRVTAALSCLCLLLLSAACSTVQRVTVPAPCLALPAEILQPTPVPYPPLSGEHLTYGETVIWADALLDALDSANKDKAAVLTIEKRRTQTGGAHVKG